MAGRVRITVIDKDTRFNFALPIGLVSRILRFGGDIANLVAKRHIAMRNKVQIEDYKVIANFLDALKEVEPFTLLEVHDKDTYVLIRTE